MYIATLFGQKFGQKVQIYGKKCVFESYYDFRIQHGQLYDICSTSNLVQSPFKALLTVLNKTFFLFSIFVDLIEYIGQSLTNWWLVRVNFVESFNLTNYKEMKIEATSYYSMSQKNTLNFSSFGQF